MNTKLLNLTVPHKIFFSNLFYMVIFLFLSAILHGGGHGSSVPFAVFFAPFLMDIYSGNYEQNIYPFFQMPIYCIVCLLFYYEKMDKRFAILIPTLHFICSIIAVFVFNKFHISHSHYYFFAFSNFIMLFYWRRFLFYSKISKT